MDKRAHANVGKLGESLSLGARDELFGREKKSLKITKKFTTAQGRGEPRLQVERGPLNVPPRREQGKT